MSSTRQNLRRLAAVASLSWVLSVPASASAQGATATALYEAARKEMKAGNYASACPKLEESNRLVPAPGTLLNLAACEEKIGRLATAWQHFTEAAQKFDRGDKRVGYAKKQAAALEPRVPKLTIRLSAAAPMGTRIIRDGVELGSPSIGLALPVDPGVRTIRVEVEGHEPKEFKVEMKEGGREEILVEPGPEQAAAAVVAPPPQGGNPPLPDEKPLEPKPSPTPSNTVAWVAGGVGLVGVLVGATSGLLANGKKDDADAECPNQSCTSEGIALVDDGEQLSTISFVGWGVGIVGLGVSAFLFLSAKGSEKPAADSARRLPRQPTGLEVSTGRGFAGLRYRGRF